METQKEVLIRLIKHHYLKNITDPIVRGIEIGTLGGLTLKYLLNRFPQLFMVTIDPKPCWTDLHENLKHFRERVKIIEQKSDDAYTLWKPQEFDFVWIDGDHSYEQVKKDIRNYLPLVKAHGFIGGHDYNSAYGVKQAVDEVFGNTITIDNDATWWIKISDVKI